MPLFFEIHDPDAFVAHFFNGLLDQLAGLLIVVVAVMAMISGHALMGITAQYGWIATILAAWLFYWRNRKNAAENG